MAYGHSAASRLLLVQHNSMHLGPAGHSKLSKWCLVLPLLPQQAHAPWPGNCLALHSNQLDCS